MIDTWGMEKEKVLKDVSGGVTVRLPGKNYVAVLAEKTD